MKAYIRGIGMISPQPTFDNSVFLEDIRSYDKRMLSSVEPDYKEFIKPIQLRRMSRVLRMGVTAAGICLRDAGVEMPDAIITGTGLGMMEDTEKFLGSVIDNEEKFLTPTSFIQSTHNTVGAHIAVMLGCNKYNFTYVHGPVSFESALLDSFMRLDENPEENILCGGAEEITDLHFRITDSAEFWKKEDVKSIELLKYKSEGTIAGEGSTFFLLNGKPSDKDYAVIRGVKIMYKADTVDLHQAAMDLLQENGLGPADIDVLFLGMNGDIRYDRPYQQFLEKMPDDMTPAVFKHLCGEHYLASTFALWTAARALKNNHLPEACLFKKHAKQPAKLENILIYNQYKNSDHSLILVTK